MVLASALVVLDARLAPPLAVPVAALGFTRQFPDTCFWATAVCEPTWPGVACTSKPDKMRCLLAMHGWCDHYC